MDRTYIKEMRKMLKTAYNNLKDGKEAGCYYLPLEDDLFLVIAYSEDDQEVVAKVAYNCDDLQSDYYMDWYYPVSKKVCECCYTELTLSDEHFRRDAEFFYKECKGIIRNRKQGLVVDWRNY